jgi:signal transduction histidine kinase
MGNHNASKPTASELSLDEPLPNSRRERYTGGGLSVSLEGFEESNRTVVVRLYDFVTEVEQRLKRPVLEAEGPVDALREVLETLAWREVGQQAQTLSSTKETDPKLDALSRAIHDIRGGAWTALWGLFQFIDAVGPSGSTAREAFWLARDHGKMMRNAVSDLDPERTRRDRAAKLHSIELLVEKWRASRTEGEHRFEVDVHCEYEGAIAERCLEFAALDRVLYNLLNNARRHSAEDCAELWMLPSPPEEPRDVRFMVRNPIEPSDRERLNEFDDLGELFSPEVSSTGSGLGLSIAAEFVANAYGLETPDDAVEQGHVGVQREDERLGVWVHWPIVD